MIELSKACVKDFKATGDNDALLFPYYDTSDPRYFDKRQRRGHKDVFLKRRS